MSDIMCWYAIELRGYTALVLCVGIVLGVILTGIFAKLRKRGKNAKERNK